MFGKPRTAPDPASWRTTTPVLDLERARVVYPGASTPALADVTLQVAPGEFVYLIGSSGSGKSTLLKVGYAAARLDSGRARVAGHELGSLRRRDIPAFRRRIGVVFQDYALLPDRSVADNVAFALHVVGRRDLAAVRVPETLELVGLGHKANDLPSALSGGEQQRVAIARAIVNRPVLLLADEPTGNLDPTTSDQVMGVLDRVNRLGTTVVMATHDVNLVDARRRRVVHLHHGELIRDEAVGTYAGHATAQLERQDG